MQPGQAEVTEESKQEFSSPSQTEELSGDIPDAPDQSGTPDEWEQESQETLQDVYGGRDRSHIQNAFKLSEPETSESK